jgi:capsular polysaccharide biosynthesis protein
MNEHEFSPRESVERALTRWWIIVLLTVLGGIIGWVFHLFQPPVYEATATITVTMEFHKWEMTQYEEDHAFNAAEAIINSIAVKNQIIAEARTRGFPIDFNQLQRQMFLERKQSVWELHVRDREPTIATLIANIWAEKGMEALDIALEHAIQVDILEDKISGLAKNSSDPGLAQSYGEIQVTIKNWISEWIQEKSLSKGVLSIMTFALTDPAATPISPSLYNLGTMVMAGACIGFVISLWAANSKKVLHRG